MKFSPRTKIFGILANGLNIAVLLSLRNSNTTLMFKLTMFGIVGVFFVLFFIFVFLDSRKNNKNNSIEKTQ